MCCDKKIESKLQAWLRGENEVYTAQAMQNAPAAPTRAESYANTRAVSGRKPVRHTAIIPAPVRVAAVIPEPEVTVSRLSERELDEDMAFDAADECTASRYESLTGSNVNYARYLPEYDYDDDDDLDDVRPLRSTTPKKVIYAQIAPEDIQQEITTLDEASFVPTPIPVRKAPPPHRDARLMAVNKFGHIVGPTPPADAPEPVLAPPAVIAEPVVEQPAPHKVHPGVKRVPGRKIGKQQHNGKRPQRGVNVTGVWPVEATEDKYSRFGMLDIRQKGSDE